MPKILDPCCGGRMMWFDRQHPDAIFGDRRSETLTVTDRSHGREDGRRGMTHWLVFMKPAQATA